MTNLRFSKKAIANILSLKDAINQYRVMYDSEGMEFVIYCNKHELPTMLFKMHSSGLHYFDPL
jgi:hypothetical protein